MTRKDRKAKREKALDQKVSDVGCEANIPMWGEGVGHEALRSKITAGEIRFAPFPMEGRLGISRLSQSISVIERDGHDGLLIVELSNGYRQFTDLATGSGFTLSGPAAKLLGDLLRPAWSLAG